MKSNLKWHLSILPYDLIVFLVVSIGSSVVIPTSPLSSFVAPAFAGLNHGLVSANREWVEADRRKLQQEKG